MKKHIFSISVIGLVLIGMFCGAYFVEAGFGVTPPYIKNDRLIPGAHIEETIYLVRGTPDQDQGLEITSIDAPGFEGWITIEKGMKFILPKGVQQCPMKVMIDVPQDAPFGAYEGFINLRTVPAGGEEGQVATLLGGRIDISLIVSENGVTDFKIKGVSIPDFEKGDPLAFFIMLENTGNTRVKPSKVHVEVYNLDHKKVLTSGDVFEMNDVASFETRQVEGKIAVDLEVGEYWVDITPYKGEEALDTYKIHFFVLPEGALREKKQAGEGEGMSGLIFSLIIMTLLIIIAIFVLTSEKKIDSLSKSSKESKKRIIKVRK